MRGRYDICLLTYEKFSALVLGNPYLLEDIATVVIDEVQMISDKSRGMNLEFILTYLKRRAQLGTAVQIIALSAVVGDTNGLEQWLDARLLWREDRPVPLNEGTLATGVNTPAEAVVIVGLMHPLDVPYSIAEYKSMVGRAGRLGFAPEGFSFLIALNPHEEQRLWRDYVLAHPENLTSRFLDLGTDLRSIIIRVLAALEHATRTGLAAADIAGFLAASFGAYRARYETPDWQWEPAAIAQAITELLHAGLLENADAGKLRLTALGKFCGEAGVEVRSAMRVIEAARGMGAGSINDPTLITLTQITLELDGIHFPLNKRGAEKERLHWSDELRGQGAMAAVNYLRYDAQSVEQVAKRVKKAVACLYWIAGTPMNNIEQALMQFDRNKDAAGPVRSIANRTADLLDVVGRIVGFVHPGINFSDRLARLNVRLQLGIGSAMAGIGRITGGQFTRAEYRLLEQRGLDSLEKIRDTNDEELIACFEFD